MRSMMLIASVLTLAATSAASANQSVIDMISKSTERQIGAKWVPTAIRLAKLESGLRCDAINKKSRASGVFQVLPSSARALGYSPKYLTSCQHGIDAGVAHMKSCISSGVSTSDQMARCHLTGTAGWKSRPNKSVERYVRLAAK